MGPDCLNRAGLSRAVVIKAGSFPAPFTNEEPPPLRTEPHAATDSVTFIMEELLRHLIYKAESCGGAEWLRRCLEEEAVPSVSASADMEHAQSVPIEDMGNGSHLAVPLLSKKEVAKITGEKG